MGAKLEKLYTSTLQSLDARTKGIMSVRITVKMGVKPADFATVADTPEILAKLQKTFNELGIK